MIFHCPGILYINPKMWISTSIAGHTLKIPILAGRWMGRWILVAIAFGNWADSRPYLMGVLYEIRDPYKDLYRFHFSCPAEKATSFIQDVYKQPVRKELIMARVREIKEGGSLCAVSSIPNCAEEYGMIAAEAGADIFVVQSTVVSVQHISSVYQPLDFRKFCASMPIPVMVGNCDLSVAVTYGGRYCRLLWYLKSGAAMYFSREVWTCVPQNRNRDCASEQIFTIPEQQVVPIITDG